MEKTWGQCTWQTNAKIQYLSSSEFHSMQINFFKQKFPCELCLDFNKAKITDNEVKSLQKSFLHIKLCAIILKRNINTKLISQFQAKDSSVHPFFMIRYMPQPMWNYPTLQYKSVPHFKVLGKPLQNLIQRDITNVTRHNIAQNWAAIEKHLKKKIT